MKAAEGGKDGGGIHMGHLPKLRFRKADIAAQIFLIVLGRVRVRPGIRAGNCFSGRQGNGGQEDARGPAAFPFHRHPGRSPAFGKHFSGIFVVIRGEPFLLFQQFYDGSDQCYDGVNVFSTAFSDVKFHVGFLSCVIPALKRSLSISR